MKKVFHKLDLSSASLNKHGKSTKAFLRAQGVLTGCIVFLTCVGCGPPSKMQVSGQVTFDGKPIQQGEIVFQPVEHTSGPTTGGSITNGEYRVQADKGLT